MDDTEQPLSVDAPPKEGSTEELRHEIENLVNVIIPNPTEL